MHFLGYSCLASMWFWSLLREATPVRSFVALVLWHMGIFHSVNILGFGFGFGLASVINVSFQWRNLANV